MTDEEKFRFEQRLKIARVAGYTKASEQKRILDHIEQAMWDAKTPEACEALLSLAYVILEGKGQ